MSDKKQFLVESADQSYCRVLNEKQYNKFCAKHDMSKYRVTEIKPYAPLGHLDLL